MKKTNKGDQSVVKHLDDADLISHLDGEMTVEEQFHARTHLESCWTCRSHLNSVQSSIEKFLRVRKQIVPAELPPGGPALSHFRRRLAQHDSMAAPLRHQLMNFLRQTFARDAVSGLAFGFQLNKALLGVAIAALVVLLTVVIPSDWSKVSASELLQRAGNYELLNEVSSARIVRARVRIERIALTTGTHKNLGEIQTANDNSSFAMYVVEQESSGVVQQKLISDRTNIVDAAAFVADFNPATADYLSVQGWLPQVSNSSYKRLIGGRGINGDDGVIAVHRGDSYELHHPFAAAHPSLISKTVFVIDANNYSPRSVSIFTIENSERYEYRIDRVALETIDRTPEIARLFEVSVREENGHSSNNQPLHKAEPKKESKNEVPLPEPVPVVATARLEVEVLGLLNQIDADLGQEVIVNRLPNGKLKVEAVVDTDERKRQIVAALSTVASNSAISIEIETSYEASQKALNSHDSAAPSASAITTKAASGNSIAVQHQVREYLERRGVTPHLIDTETGRIANQVVGRSHRAMLHVWALKGLLQRFSPQDLETLDHIARSKWLQMITTHARRFQTEAAALRKEIAAILNSQIAEASAAQITDDAGLIQALSQLIETASSNHEVIRSAFTISNNDSAISAITTSQFSRSMAKAEAIAASINSATQKLK
ncbi:MAG TPA: hypothetical protein VJU84_06855 [Pyrinomonadaceae bacterium]|nr:hypothetical protein [Pyrinomonadaceae bacterium]